MVPFLWLSVYALLFTDVIALTQLHSNAENLDIIRMRIHYRKHRHPERIRCKAWNCHSVIVDEILTQLYYISSTIIIIKSI